LLKFNLKNKKSPIHQKSDNKFDKSPYEIVKEDINKVNKFIIAKLKSDVPLIPIISEHLLKSGGKRI
jgi:octaprenyl-diphosphate synthase